ncbi:MAG: Mrp/NBP35 family ATP-binding protein [Ruminococcaceae bacterium]|nr:Mrp/NBP35 family ATP-binding protein [Oscillospiraceae bacterium]
MSECTHNCETCSANCSSRSKESLLAKENPLSAVKNVIAVVSGKGGVGKSLVTTLLSVNMRRRGYETAVLDADITGPSIPRAFGTSKERAEGSDAGIFPVISKTGIKLMSLNYLLENESDPVVWRGPVIAGTVTQFWTDVVWGDVDFMFVDMPPGTGDVPLTVFQSLPIKGIVIVASPQELVSVIVEKAVKMAEMMNIPILGVVENMSYFQCPDCQSKHRIYGDSHIKQVAADHGIYDVAEIPIDAKLAAVCDKGMIELFEGDWLDALTDLIEEKGKE